MTAVRDPKRWLYLAAWTSPLIALLSIALYLWSARPLSLLLPLLHVYVVVPTLDSVLGEDRHNPEPATVAALSSARFYRGLLYVDIALLYASFLLGAWLVGTQPVPLWAVCAFALGLGLTSIDALVIGHELGHKRSRWDRAAAQLALALVGYGHFRIEHNHGHHVTVATPEDSASARMGESVYRFALREIPGALRRGWSLEQKRLSRRGLPAFSPANEILLSWSLSAAIACALIASFGPRMLPFLLLHHLHAWYGLTQANYVEHYGLLRQKLPDGRYEPPAPHHSWNSNHIFSNLILFHLQRHSDHHAHAARPYQALRDFPDLPRLPSGYPGCFGLAAVPALWFKVMDAKLLAWAGGDLQKLNVDPRARAALEARFK